MEGVENIKTLSCEGFSSFLESSGVHEDVISTFVSNRISGSTFLKLSDDDLKELVPVIGDRVFVRELLEEAHACEVNF